MVIRVWVYRRLKMMPSAAVRTAAAISAASGVYLLLVLTQLSTSPTEQTTETGTASSPLARPCLPSCIICIAAEVLSVQLTLQVLLLLVLRVLILLEGCGPYTRAMTLVQPRDTTARPSQLARLPDAPAVAIAGPSGTSADVVRSLAAADGTEVRQRSCRHSYTSRPSARKPHGETASALNILTV